MKITKKSMRSRIFGRFNGLIAAWNNVNGLYLELRLSLDSSPPWSGKFCNKGNMRPSEKNNGWGKGTDSKMAW